MWARTDKEVKAGKSYRHFHKLHGGGRSCTVVWVRAGVSVYISQKELRQNQTSSFHGNPNSEPSHFNWVASLRSAHADLEPVRVFISMISPISSLFFVKKKFPFFQRSLCIFPEASLYQLMGRPLFFFYNFMQHSLIDSKKSHETHFCARAT